MSSLRGRRFLLTRRREQAGGLVALLRKSGAEVIEAPAIAIAPPEDPGPLDGAVARLGEFDWIAFTSTNAVRAVAERASLAAPWPRIASVGPATTRAIEEALGRSPELVPARAFRAEGLAQALVEAGVAGKRVLLPLSDLARDTLEAGLAAAGALVERVTAYRTLAPPGAAEALRVALEQGFDLALFASPSAVENAASLLGDRARGLPAGVIGPVTKQAADAAGLDVRVVAEPSTAAGLVEALGRYLGRA
ncbi:MAG TPA: uroporphyrinogen-III synthase [Vicinamibacteria bacterium]|nr:uroporphyrinogen-III synthase [Vicinamibacteria bacterium]